MFERAKKKSKQEGIVIGRQEGRQIGRKEGRQEIITQMYKKLLTLGVSRDIIEKAMPA